MSVFRKSMIWVVIVSLYIAFSWWPTWKAVSLSRSARDYATYHYAVQVAVDGDSPYQTKLLGKKSKAEKTRKKVHPYFYPPPALLGMLWAKQLSLATAYKLFFLMNQFALLLSLWTCWKWLRVEPIWLGILAVSFTPLSNSITMGQVNIIVLSVLLLAIYRRSGWLLSVASMVKMSPALLLLPYGIWKKWSLVLHSILGAIGLSLMTLWLVDLSTQLYFYRDVLPQFSSGKYLDLKVAISIPGNHSIPDIYNHLLPGETKYVLSKVAQRAASITIFVIIILLSIFAKKNLSKHSLKYILGAFITIMVIAPVYTYEHHLVFMIIPVVTVFAALRKHGASKLAWATFLLAYFCLAMKWGAVKWAFDNCEFPILAWLIRESKFLACLCMGLFCIYFAKKQATESIESQD